MRHSAHTGALVRGAVTAASTLIVALVVGCGAERPDDGTLPVVVVSIEPQAYFVERIAEGRVSVSVLVGPGQSPHSYEPTPRQMADLSAASMWLCVGAEFEKSLRPKAAALYKSLPIVDTTTGVQYRKLEAHAHDDGDGDHDEEGGLDPHVWLGRQAVKAMAANIRDALAAADPAGEDAYAANHDAFVRDADAAYDELASALAGLRGTTAFVYHPAFGYLLDEFGIAQEAVETGGKEPTQKALAAMIKAAREDGASLIFVQAQFPTSAAEAVAEAIGATVVPIDPLARDWLDNLRRIGDELARMGP
ncbi:MAG TPA: zinc ABC transporter substrate-binding protein [Spirochaetales bacterium]|nr:zinc ABC transporter substrate-binding protein [Spirochaetales bacterium]